MPINTENDEVVVYQDVGFDWRWYRRDKTNGKTVSQSSEGYVDQEYAMEAALAYNRGVEVRVDE